MGKAFYPPKRNPYKHEPFFGDISTAALMQHAQLELDVLANIAAQPDRMLRVFTDNGGSLFLFEQPDAQAMHIAMEHARTRTRIEVATACRVALEYVGYWDDTEPAWTRGMRWSCASLAAFFDSFPPCEPSTRLYTSRLVALNRRIRLAGDHLSQARALLTGEVEVPAVSTGPRAVGAMPNPILKPVTFYRKRGVA